MPAVFKESAALLGTHGDLILPLLLSLWIAWGDVRGQRIPNYLTLSSAIAGLGFQVGSQGLPGLLAGLGGMGLGFFLLFLPYLKGGMGAGDVKALAALGAWLGPTRTLYLFIYMGISGGVLILGVLWWRGILWSKLRQGWICLVNWILCRLHGSDPPAAPPSRTPGVPYGAALALGMALLCWRDF